MRTVLYGGHGTTPYIPVFVSTRVNKVNATGGTETYKKRGCKRVNDVEGNGMSKGESEQERKGAKKKGGRQGEKSYTTGHLMLLQTELPTIGIHFKPVYALCCQT